MLIDHAVDSGSARAQPANLAAKLGGAAAVNQMQLGRFREGVEGARAEFQRELGKQRSIHDGPSRDKTSKPAGESSSLRGSQDAVYSIAAFQGKRYNRAMGTLIIKHAAQLVTSTSTKDTMRRGRAMGELQ